MSEIFWLPLESNPDVMNDFIEKLGVPIEWGISDILSLEEEHLQMVPRPVLAVILLFPTSEKYSVRQEEILKSSDSENVDPKVYFMRQTIRNACGTMALIHAIANSRDHLNLKEDSLIAKLIHETLKLPPKDKAQVLEQSNEISAAHAASAVEGQTQAPGIGEKCKLHFIALVHVNSKLYELDGSKSAPIVHGSTTTDTFLQDAARVCKEYMARDPDNVNFTALSFGAL